MSKRKKSIAKITAVILTLTMICSSIVYATGTQKPYSKELRLDYNADFSRNSTKSLEKVNFNDTVLFAELSDIGEDYCQAKVSLQNNENCFELYTSGEKNTLITPQGNAVHYVLSGELKCNGNSDNDIIGLIDNWIDLSIITTDSGDSFAVVNIGTAFDNHVPITAFYGNYTDAIRVAYKSLIEKEDSDIKVVNDDLNSMTGEARSSSISYLATRFYNSTVGGYYSLGSIHLYGRTSFASNTLGRMVAKVNSNCNEVISYVNANMVDIGQVALSAQPDKVCIKLGITNRNLSFVDILNGYPTQSQKSIDFNTIKDILAMCFGYTIPTLPSLVLSSVLCSDDAMPNRAYKWDMYKLNGMGNLDGGYDDVEGVNTRCYMYTDDNLDHSVSETVTASATIRYYYTVADVYDVFVGYFTAGNLNSGASYNVTITP